MIKSRRMRWAGHVARMRGGRGVHAGYWSGNLRERDHLDDARIDGRIISKCILHKYDGRGWTVLIWFRIQLRGRFFWVPYRTFGFHNVPEILD
jgi:hypothetical protein